MHIDLQLHFEKKTKSALDALSDSWLIVNNVDTYDFSYGNFDKFGQELER